MFKPLTTALLVFGLMLGYFAQPAIALTDEEKAKLVGAAVGLAIAGKIAQQRREELGDRYIARRLATGPVYCYPRVRQCFFHGKFAPNTTATEFGYR